MKSSGIVRKLDKMGRIVLPIEMRRTLGIEVKDPVEIFVDRDSIILKKCQPVCIFCGSELEIVEFKGKKVCRGCLEKL